MLRGAHHSGKVHRNQREGETEIHDDKASRREREYYYMYIERESERQIILFSLGR